MLHYNIMVVVVLVGLAQAQVPRGPVTLSERAQLNQVLALQTVEVRRYVPPPPGITVPGGAPDLFRGWLAAPDRVVTSSLVVQGWPQGPGDTLEVKAPDGAWHPAAVGLMDAQAGIAVLDVRVPAPGEAQLADERRLQPGRGLFALGGSQPVDVQVAERAEGHLGWYWRLRAPPLVPGTPLFDGQGRLVTLVGAPALLALPTEAIDTLVARRPDWRP
jgi:hypothetical protein